MIAQFRFQVAGSRVMMVESTGQIKIIRPGRSITEEVFDHRLIGFPEHQIESFASRVVAKIKDESFG